MQAKGSGWAPKRDAQAIAMRACHCLADARAEIEGLVAGQKDPRSGFDGVGVGHAGAQ